MLEKTELIMNTGLFEDSRDSVHEVIFNRLDIPHSNNGKNFTYDPEEFKAALPLFKDVPLVFANIHPTKIGKLPLEDALKEVDGRLAGTPQDVLVNNTGTLFRGSVDVTDPEAENLIREGKAMLSTAFFGTPDENGVLRNIIPNHILIYPAATKILPGDTAALFLNQSSDTMTDEKNEQLDLMRELILNQNAKDELQGKIAEQSELIFNQKSEIEDLTKTVAQKDELLTKKEELISNQASAIEALNVKVAELTKTIDENRISEKNKRRERIFNQYLKGTQKAFEARKEEIFDDSKYEDLIFEMNQHQANVKQPPTEAQGTESILNQGEEDEVGKWLNGVDMAYDSTGKVTFGGAK